MIITIMPFIFVYAEFGWLKRNIVLILCEWVAYIFLCIQVLMYSKKSFVLPTNEDWLKF